MARETYLEGLKYKSFKVTAETGLNVIDDFLEKIFPDFRESLVSLNREITMWSNGIRSRYG